MHGEHDGHGDFFSVLVRDVEYIALAGGLTVGDLVLADVISLAALTPRWSWLVGDVSGAALALRPAYTESFAEARDTFVVVAGEIVFRPGQDWSPPNR